jgi:hypothetical protein
VANQPCRWRDNWHTRGSSVPVLSYWGQLSSSFLRPRRIGTDTSVTPKPGSARLVARSFLFRLALHVAMQVGPSLHHGSRGVRRMASEDSVCLHPMRPAITPASIHGDGQSPERLKTLRAQVLTSIHRSNNSGEDEEVLLLTAQKRLRLEEGNHLCQEIAPFPDHEHQSGVLRSAMVLAYPSAAEPSQYQVQDLTPLRILADMELRNELPLGPRPRIPLDGDVKRPFSVDVTRNVGIQPFLLIDRTCRIVTAHVQRVIATSDMASSAGFSVFPAFSRIY